MTCSRRRHAQGQSITETILLLPFYLALVFGMLQAAYIGLALATTSYAAGSIARWAAKQNTMSFPEPAALDRLDKLLFAGMKAVAVKSATRSTGVLPILEVNACTKIDAFPLVGAFLNVPLNTKYDGGGNFCAPDNEPTRMGPIYFVPKPTYHFVIQGTAQIRLNVQPTK
jgi:hypothetical protein